MGPQFLLGSPGSGSLQTFLDELRLSPGLFILCVSNEKKQGHGHESVTRRGAAGCASAFRCDLPPVAADTISLGYWIYVAGKSKLCKCRVWATRKS